VSDARACDRCLRRAWLVGRLSGHLEVARPRIEDVLALDDGQLIDAVGGNRAEQIRSELAEFNPARARERTRAARVAAICGCDPDYPDRLRALDGPPAVLHVAGGLERLLAYGAEEAVAIVGARKASPYGLEVARLLGRELAIAGLPVVSGMAHGIDSAAHTGALAAGGPTIAVLPGGADRAYPAGKRQLYRALVQDGVVVSELPVGGAVRRWSFQARNRIIAALAAMTVVVEATTRSGSLVTARFARELRRPLGAVPGRVTSPAASGPNALLARGAYVVRGTQDILDLLFGEGVRTSSPDPRAELSPELGALLMAIANGHDTAAALASAGVDPERGLTALASLELAGYVRREQGGRYSVLP
jgi:DNA processing protein